MLKPLWVLSLSQLPAPSKLLSKVLAGSPWLWRCAVHQGAARAHTCCQVPAAKSSMSAGKLGTFRRAAVLPLATPPGFFSPLLLDFLLFVFLLFDFFIPWGLLVKQEPVSGL